MENAQVATKPQESFYDGSTLGSVGVSFLGTLITILTVGLLYPYAVKMQMDYEVKHTVIDGKRQYFTGTAVGLWGTWFKIWALGIITLSIYFWFASSKIRKWKVSHTHFE